MSSFRRPDIKLFVVGAVYLHNETESYVEDLVATFMAELDGET